MPHKSSRAKIVVDDNTSTDLSAEYFTEDGDVGRAKRPINEFDYLSKLCEHTILTRSEERTQLERYHDPNSTQARRNEAFEVLVSSNIKLIMHVAKFYADTWRIPLDDLVQEGTIGLIRAIQGFNLEKNVRLSTYATGWIRQAISRQSPTLARNIRLPSHVITALHKISRMRETLEEQNKRLPSDQELADALKMALPKLQLYLVVEADTGSLNEKVGESANSELGDLIANKPERNDSERSRIISDALNQLPSRHRQALMQKYDERMRIGEIADFNRITIGQARSLLREAEAQLKRLLQPHEGELA